jgi:hypothetical protein
VKKNQHESNGTQKTNPRDEQAAESRSMFGKLLRLSGLVMQAEWTSGASEEAYDVGNR